MVAMHAPQGNGGSDGTGAPPGADAVDITPLAERARAEIWGDLPMGLHLQIGGRMIDGAIRDLYGDLDLGPEGLAILIVLGARHGLLQGDYAKLLYMNATTFGRHVQALVQSGLVRRSVPETDRRAVVLSLTDDGHARLAQVRTRIGEREALVRASLGSEQFDALQTGLAELTAVMAGLREGRAAGT
ncbi:hypothetical protein DXV76_09985 [Rhodobacteraceae bacterium CCMM004]|nr:hypothetical protein DXV76_09985 [Rhodobacteraceae bacterium CCMM004]